MPIITSALVVVALAVSVVRADVVTTVAGSKLTVTGDDASQSLAIGPADDGVVLEGRSGTLVDGTSAPVTIPGIDRLVVKLGRGPDYLTVTDVWLRKGLTVRLGNGNDILVLDGVGGGTTRVRAGNDSDTVRIYGPSQLQRLDVHAGSGWDYVLVDGVWVPGDVDIDAGPDPDDVTIVWTEIRDDLDVHLGDDDDILLLGDVLIFDDADLDGDDGDDVLLSDWVWVNDDVDVDGFGDGYSWWW